MTLKLSGFGLLSILTVGSVFADGVVSRKKYISFGWEFRNATPAQLLANAGKLNGSGIDGVGIYLQGTNSVGQELKFVSGGSKWEREAFAAQISDFRRMAETPGLSESLLVGFGAPEKRMAWTDDAAWANLANGMSVLGWILHKSGLKGINSDPEDYYRQNQFYWIPTDPDWETTVKLARKRGAQVFGALFREKPDAKVLFYWLLTLDRDYFNTQNPQALMASKRDLWPAFVDGILDVLPPTATLIDGDEHSYSYEARLRGFHRSFANQKLDAPMLVSPENRKKYRRQVQVAFAFYLDAYVNETGPWYFGPENGSRAAHFRRNLAEATRLADEYVWFWGERNLTVRWEDIRIDRRVDRREKTWNEALPGLDDIRLCCKAPDRGFARRYAALKAAGKLVDLVSNPGCAADGRLPFPKPFDSWKMKADKAGTFFYDETDGCAGKGCLALRGTRSGCIIYPQAKVSPGEMYAVELAVKDDAPYPVMRFRKDHDWMRGLEEVSVIFGEPDANGWRHGIGMVEIPEDADEFWLLVHSRFRDDGNVLKVDDVHVYRLW